MTDKQIERERQRRIDIDNDNEYSFKKCLDYKHNYKEEQPKRGVEFTSIYYLSYHPPFHLLKTIW